MGNTLRLVIMALVAALVLVALALYISIGGRSIQSAQQSTAESKLRLANLAGSCQSSVGDDGYGIFNVKRPTIISSENGEIKVPCKIKLESGASLTLRDVELRSRNIAISDYGSNGESRLRIEGSTLIGVGQYGFFTKLSDSVDTVYIDGSTLDYPMGVWATVLGPVNGGERDGGRIDLTASTVRSLDSESEGIQFVVGPYTGVGNFLDLKLETVQLDPDLDPRAKNILLLAGECRVERVEGYEGAACDPEDVLRQEQQQ